MTPRRRSVRLPRFDYRTPGAYFVTVCTRDRLPLFGEIRNGVMHLSPLGRIVEAEWRLLPARRPGVQIDASIVMPDHFHGIVWIVDDHSRGAINCAPTNCAPTAPRVVEAGSLSSIIRAFKAGVTREAGHPVWQRGFYEHVIRHPRALENIRRYIAENPMRWSLKHEAHPFTLPSMMPSM